MFNQHNKFFSNYSILNMKYIFWILWKVDTCILLNVKAPVGNWFQTCELQTSYWHFNLLYYTVNLDIDQKRKKYMCMIIQSILLFVLRKITSQYWDVLYLSKFFISLVLLNWGWLTFIQFFFLSKKDQLYDLIQLDIL